MDILTQDEADTLRVIEKYLIEPESVLIPPPQKTCIIIYAIEKMISIMII